jgi:hypothetical protein
VYSLTAFVKSAIGMIYFCSKELSSEFITLVLSVIVDGTKLLVSIYRRLPHDQLMLSLTVLSNDSSGVILQGFHSVNNIVNLTKGVSNGALYIFIIHLVHHGNTIVN